MINFNVSYKWGLYTIASCVKRIIFPMDYHKNELAENVLSQLPRDHLFCLSCQIKEEKKRAFISNDKGRVTRCITILLPGIILFQPWALASLWLILQTRAYSSAHLCTPREVDGITHVSKVWVKFIRWNSLCMRQSPTLWERNRGRGCILLCPPEICRNS